MAKIYIDNAKYMEFIDEMATQITIQRFGEDTYEEVQGGSLTDEVWKRFTDDAQDFYNEQYDWAETVLNNTLNIHSNVHLNTDN